MNAVEKLGAYDLIVTLIPGLLLMEALKAAGMPLADASEVATYGVSAYVLGLLASRAGSLIISRLAKRIDRKPSEPNWYSSFVSAEKMDPKIQTLVQVANGYRSLCGGVLVYFGVLILSYLAEAVGLSKPLRLHIVVAALGLIFFISYIKQNRYISERTKVNTDG